jgi:hypothetical protein
MFVLLICHTAVSILNDKISQASLFVSSSLHAAKNIALPSNAINTDLYPSILVLISIFNLNVHEFGRKVNNILFTLQISKKDLAKNASK